MMHRALPAPPPRSERLQLFFKKFAKGHSLRGAWPLQGLSVIDQGILDDFDEHWGGFSLLEKQQVLMSFLQMDPEKLKQLGKEGQDLIQSIIDTKAQIDVDAWIV